MTNNTPPRHARPPKAHDPADEPYRKISLNAPERMLDRIDDELGYRDNRSEWIRDAMRRKLNDENDENEHTQE